MKAFGLAVLAACLGFSPAWAITSGGDQSFEFRKGTRWKYTGTVNGVKMSVIQEVFQISQGDLFAKGEPATLHHLMMRTMNADTGDFESFSTTSYLGLEGGYFVTGSLAGVPVRLFKLGSREGDSWLCTDPRLKNVPDRRFVHLGTEKIAVPAGTFKSARHIQVQIRTAAGIHTGDFYVVPGVGLIKTEAHSEENGEKKIVILELESFHQPGEF